MCHSDSTASSAIANVREPWQAASLNSQSTLLKAHGKALAEASRVVVLTCGVSSPTLGSHLRHTWPCAICEASTQTSKRSNTFSSMDASAFMASMHPRRRITSGTTTRPSPPTRWSHLRRTIPMAPPGAFMQPATTQVRPKLPASRVGRGTYCFSGSRCTRRE